MDGYKQLMDENYKRQHYPNGFFSAVVEGKRSMTAGYIVLVVFVLFSLPFFFLGIRGIAWGLSMVTNCVIIGIGVFLVLLGIALLMLLKKQKGKTREDWVQQVAKRSGYPTEVIEEFDRQMTTGEAYFLTPNGKYDKMKESILTDDFIKISEFVFKQSDLKAACLFFLEDSVNAGNKIKFVKTLHVGLISDRCGFWIEADKNRGSAFIAMLKEKFPEIETKDGTILKNKEFHALMKEYITAQ
ncbi:hypothetical protein [Clostridium sp. AN503]|uniref:hypothetical protein n=1 Tax=Clostridium sp. AN503 TaxID=3160598 RepID=UPI003458A6A1